MAALDLSQYGAPQPLDSGPSSAVDLSGFGSEAPLTTKKRGFLAGIEDAIGGVYGPGAKALSDSVPGQAAFARSLVAGVPSGAEKVIKGVGSAVDAADRLLMSPEEREAFDYGQRTLGPAPSFSGTVAPAARAARKARNALAPKDQTQGDQIAEGLGQTAGLIGAAAINPALGAAAFGATGAQDIQDDAERKGVAGTPAADVAVVGNAGAQSALGAIVPSALAGRAVPQLAKTYGGRLLTSTAGNALVGAAMPAAENAIAGSTYDPGRNVLAGVPESAAQMALLGTVAHVATDRPLARQPEGPPPKGKSAAPDLSGFGTPANDVAQPQRRAPADARLTPNEARTTGPAQPPAKAPKLDPVPGVSADDFPGDWSPSPARAQPEATQPSGPDITDRALDVIRSGGKVRVDQGPSLTEFLARNGGVQDTGGNLAGVGADRWHAEQPFRNRLVQPNGRSLEDAAQAAYEAGYFPELPPPRMDSGDNMQAVSPDLLVSAVRDEMAGRTRFAKTDEANSELAQHVEDLDQITQELGLDPKTMSNADIKAAINDHFSQPDRRLGARATAPDPNQLGFEGFGSADPTREAIASELQRRDARRGSAGAADGGLFDEAGRAQLDMYGDGTKAAETGDNGALSGASPDTGTGSGQRLGMFAGRSAATADFGSLERARQMETSGATPADVWEATGWGRGDDGHWRFEISDQNARFRSAPSKGLFRQRPVGLDIIDRLRNGGVARLDELIDHPRLFEAYPKLRKVGVVVDPEMRANGAADGNTLILSPRVLAKDPSGEQLRSVVLHEVQHVIQRREGFAQGGPANADGLREMGLGSHLDTAFLDGAFPSAAGDVYRRLSGEIEARNTADRRLMSEQERRDAPPDTTRDVPRGKSIVVTDGRGRTADHDAREARDARLAARFGERRPIDLSAYGDAVRGSGHVVSGLREAPRTGAVPAADPAHIAKLDASISEMAQRLRDALGLTHRQGRLTLRKAEGEFDPKTGVVRTKSVHELDVIAHEAFHKVEFDRMPAVEAALKAHAADLKPLAYPGAPVSALREEGFAEFGRWYLTNPDYARKVAPKFYDAFEAALGKDAPKALKEMQGIQRAYQELLKAPSAAVARSLVVKAVKPSPVKTAIADVRQFGLRGAVEKWSNDLYRQAVDDLHPLHLAVRDLLKTYAENKGHKLTLKAAENPYALARMSRGAYATGHMHITEGVVPYHGTKPEGPSIPDALHKAFGAKGWSEDAYQDFGAYLVSRRLVHEWERYETGALGRPPDKFSRATHEQAIKDFEAAHPTWSDAAEMVYRWNDNLWQLEHEAGFITGEAYEKGRTEHPDYVPLQRDMTDRQRAGGPGVSGNRKFAGGTRAFRGSTRDVINPIQSMMQRAYNLAALTARNDVIKSLDALGDKAGNGSGAIVERLPAHEMKAINVDAVEALEKAAKDAGLSKRDMTTLLETVTTELEGHTQATLFRPGEINDRGEPIIYLWKGGEKIPLRLPDGDFGRHMFEVLTGMNRQAKNLFVEVFSAPSRLLRLGVTTQPEFFFSNYIRDQMANWILTDVGFKPFVSGARGVADALTPKSETARTYNVIGGLSGGANVASLDHARINRDIAALKHNGSVLRRFASFEGLIHASEISETGTRMSLFRLAYKQARKQGLSEYESAVEAAFTARDVLDFDRHGSRMLSAMRTITFLNASVQGLDKARRVLTAEGALGRDLRSTVATVFGDKTRALTPAEKARLVTATKAWAKVAALGVMGLSLTALYKNDPDYEEVSDYLRATHWVVKGPGGEWLVVPKPFELAVVSNVLERGYEALVKHDPTAWGRLVQGLGDVLVPPHEITALAVPFQIAANRSSTGTPIIPDHLRYSVAPEMQFNAYTSQLSRNIGKAIGVSPAVIDYLVTGFGGSWGRTFLSATDTALKGRQAYNGADPADMFIARRFIRDETRGSTSSKEFWDLVSQSGGKLTQDVGTFRQLVNDGKQEDARAYLQKLSTPERAFVVVQVFGTGGDKQLEPISRASKAVSVISDLRRDLASGPIRGPQNSEIKLSQAERTKVDEALSYLSMSEMRNALIAAGIDGWQQKQPIARRDALQRIYAVSPPVSAALNLRMRLEGVVPPEQAGDVEAAWQQSRGRIADVASSPALPAAMVAKEFKGRAGAMRFLRTAPSQTPAINALSGSGSAPARNALSR